MAKQRYIVMPEIEWVNGAPVPLDRLVLLTPEEARYDLAQGRIYLDGAQPPVTPAVPVLVDSDVVPLSRNGLSHRVTIADLAAFLDGQGGGPTLALSTLVFQSGVSAGAILAAITMPAGWQAVAETTFGGRATVSGSHLVAAIDIAAATATMGTIRLKATSPDTLTSVIRTFSVAFEAVTVPPAPDVTPPTITSATAFSQAENSALVVTLTANEAVTWAKIGGTDAAAFVLDAAAGTLTLAAKDFDAPTDSDGNNTYAVQIRATDAAGNASTQTLTVTVTNLLDIPRTALTASSVTMAYNAAIGARVLDLPPLVEGEARAVSVSWLTPDSATGDVFRNAMTGPAQSTVEQQIPVDVTTTQGGLNPVTTRFTIVVPAVTAADTTPPTITSATAFSQAENSALVVTLTANEAVTWAKIGGTDAAAFTLDAAAGTLTLAGKDFDVPSDSDGNNTFAVQIRATDAAGNASTQTITVTITNLFDTPRQPLTASSVTMAYNAANGTRVLDLPPLVEGEARAVSVSWLTPDSATGDVFRNAMAGPAQSTVEQQIPVDVTTTQGGANPVVTRFTIVVPAVAATPRLGLSSRAVWLGNSVDAFNFARSYRQWTLANAGGRFIQPIGGALANGGDTMVDMAQRIPAMQANAPHVVMLGSATNDLSEAGITLATLKSRLATLVDAVLAANAKCVVQLTKTSTGITGAKETLRQQLNADTQSTYGSNANVVIADFTSIVSPGTDPSVTYDGTHFNAKGSQLAGQAVAAQFRGLITTDPLIPVSGAMAGNLNSAFDMAGTGGTISGGTGQVPTGYIVANASGATMVSEIVANAVIDGRTVARALRLRFSGSATDAAGDVTVKRTQSSVPYSPGSSFSASQLVRFGKADGAGAPTGDPAGLAFFGINTGTTSSLMSKSLDGSVQGIPYGFDGTMRTHPASSQGVGTQLAWEGGWRFAVGAVDFVIDIALVNFTKEETVPYAAPFYQSVRRNRPSDGLAYGVYSQAAITGTLAVGNVLTCGVGTWSGGGDPDKTVANGGMVFSYQWARDGVAISGATARTYTAQASGVHTCDVTATNSFGSATMTTPGVSVP